MSEPWSYHLFRYGDEISAPSVEQVRAAVSELYHENIPGMAEGDDEHGAASLRYGYDDGPMYVLEITRHGVARWGGMGGPGLQRRNLPDQRAAIHSSGSIDPVRAAFNTST
jgi:hypothetical protein